MRRSLIAAGPTFRRIAFFTCINLLSMAPTKADPPPQGSSQPGGAAAHSARRSLSELRCLILGMHAKIRSLVMEMDSSNSEQFDETIVRSVAAAKGFLRRHGRYHLNEPIEDDPSAEVQILNGGFDVYYPFSRRYEKAKVQVRPEHTIKIYAATPFELLAWWPPGDTTSRPRVHGRSFFLKDVLEDQRCTVRPSLEQASGLWCHVIEIPGLEALWIDGETGVLLRRECRATEKRSPIVYEFGDFQDFGNGIILPRRFTADNREGP